MEQFLTAIGIVIGVFLVLSAAVESILEIFRGFTGKLIPRLTGAVSLDEAVRQAQSFAPDNGQLHARLNGIKSAADRIGHDVTERLNAAKSILDEASGALSEAQAAMLSERMNEAANQVTTAISEYERHRILMLRLLAGMIGIGISLWAGIDAFVFLAQDPSLPDSFRQVAENWYFGEIITGMAAASGSSFWHDQLDRVRSLKNVQQQAAALMR